MITDNTMPTSPPRSRGNRNSPSRQRVNRNSTLADYSPSMDQMKQNLVLASHSARMNKRGSAVVEQDQSPVLI